MAVVFRLHANSVLLFADFGNIIRTFQILAGCHMKKMLITGGTVFVSQYAAQYFADKFEVHVLNRNTRPQCSGVNLIEGDRHGLGDKLKGKHFDAVLDITAYDGEDVCDLLNALDTFDDYILISSSAVYPESEPQPFAESASIGPNKIWGKYGTDKIAAEQALLQRVPNAYILRPPYLYGQGNNVYREAFVFDCALQNRAFYLPEEGGMNLQFFHVDDLCRFISIILDKHPEQHIFNVGNREAVTIKDWVTLCYQAVGAVPEFVRVSREVEQRSYFPFYRYEYYLDVEKQSVLLSDTKPLDQGLKEAFAWYLQHSEQVRKKPLLEFIDQKL